MYKFCTAKHCGGLKECLETESPITDEVFNILIKSGLYRFYAYDHRIKALRYILNDMEHNLGLPTWLHYYGGLKDGNN